MEKKTIIKQQPLTPQQVDDLIRRQSSRMLRLEREYERLNPGKLSKELPASDIFNKLYNELDSLIKITNGTHKI